MTEPVFFTLEGDFRGFVQDAAGDGNYSPENVAISATVTITPLLDGIVRATSASPRPIAYLAAPTVAIIDPADGRLKIRTAGEAGNPDGFSFTPVRLLANSAYLELDPTTPLFYRLTFTGVSFGGVRGSIAGWDFEAPSTDLTLNVVELAPQTGQIANGVTKIAPGGVRLDGGDIVFSFGGVDIGDAIPFTPTFASTEISDSGATGRDIVAADTAADARAVIDAEYTGNKGQAGGYAPLDGSAKIDASFLPSYVDDVVEYTNQAAFPGTGETGKIYVDKSNGDTFRWSGSAYVRISDRVTATGITDSTSVGRAVVTAASAAAARTAIDFAAGIKESRSIIDLRDWPDVLAANWKTVLAGSFTTGSNTATGTPFTAADVGKIVMAMTDNGSVSGTQTWWMTTLTGVSGTTATFADTCPITSGSLRVRYGFDGTTAINSALAEIQTYTDSPVEVYLGGNYRLTQLVIPANIVLRGVPWKDSVVPGAQANLTRTHLAQLPGAEKDFVIFGAAADFGAGIIAGAGIMDFNLFGPEKNVVGLSAATTGNGLSFRTDGSSFGWVIDWFKVSGVNALNFPESGFRCFGVVPMYFNECKAQTNGRFGYEHQWATGAGGTNALHIQNFSADWNNLGALGFKGLGANDSVFITGVKSEGTATGSEADTASRSGPGYQSNCIVFDNCDQTVALVNGVSHIRIQRAGIGPGPAITIKDSTGAGKKPRLTFNGVMERLGGWETAGTTGDAVTLRDEISSVDISRTVTSGTYPNGPAFPYLEDNYGQKIAQFIGFAPGASGYTQGGTAHLTFYNSPLFPSIAAVDSTQTNVSLSLETKGAGTIYLNAATPSITAGAAGGVDRSLDLRTRGTGRVQFNGVSAVDVSSSQTITNKNLISGTNTFPTLNQNTTGSAASLTTARSIDGQSFNGTANITVIAPATNAATSKTTPLDADVMPLVDSAESNVLKKLTWANLKSAIKSYYDSVTATLTYKDLSSATNTFPTFNQNTSGTALNVTGTVAIANGGTGSTSLVTAATASSVAARDANAFLTANGFIPSKTTTSGTGGTTTLTVASAQIQEFTNSGSQALVLPTTGVVAGQSWTVMSNGTGSVSIQSSSTGGILFMNTNNRVAVLTARIDTPTLAADWMCMCPSLVASPASAVLRDVYANITTDNFVTYKTATATAGTTTTLTIDSSGVQEFTGSTTQTVKLPTTSVTGGQQYTIINNSSGAVTVQSSGANTIATVAAGTLQLFVAQQSAPTTAAHWRAI